VLARLAELSAQNRQAVVTAMLIGYIDMQMERAGASMNAAGRKSYERAVLSAQSVLGGERFEDLRSKGRQLNVDELFAVCEDIEPSGIGTETGLTSRELEVLHLVAAGATDREIAEALFVSVRTINSHIGNIISKFGVSNRRAAAAFACERGWISEPDKPVATR
jgi:DNA-binding NarL/FixJ family response regulator